MASYLPACADLVFYFLNFLNIKIVFLCLGNEYAMGLVCCYAAKWSEHHGESNRLTCAHPYKTTDRLETHERCGNTTQKNKACCIFFFLINIIVLCSVVVVIIIIKDGCFSLCGNAFLFALFLFLSIVRTRNQVGNKTTSEQHHQQRVQCTYS